MNARLLGAALGGVLLLAGAPARAETPSGIDPSELDRQVAAKAPAFAECVARARGCDPLAAGRVEVRIEVVASGKVADVQLAPGTTATESIARCYADKFWQLAFTPPGGTVAATIALEVPPP
jgi:hypothetical protein